ncbi:MAG: hypothetical protein LLF97_08215 [Planctomycetaceae bacterium]|nr:hypothetical protein [Planctomycetaceae bacterium]
MDEIRGIPGATQAFVSSAFDHLDDLAHQWLGQELNRRQLQTAAERDGLQQQIDRLASIIGQLSETLGAPSKRNER